MSIRTYDKDHLKKNTGVALAALVKIEAPESGDPLVFWTQHENDPCEVNLHPFATGQVNHGRGGKGRKFTPFTGRPQLIRQLKPAIEESLLWGGKGNVLQCFSALREWWRILDAVEAAAAKAGQPMTRVEDVRLLTNVHEEFAHRSDIRRRPFCIFRALLDVTRVALGVRPTFWETPKDSDAVHHIPPEEQRRALRFAIKRACRSVLKMWEQTNRFSQSVTEPDDPKEADLYRHVQYMRKIQKQTGKMLPTSDELLDGMTKKQRGKQGLSLITLRQVAFPTSWDADAVWHLCLVNTGWNSSTLTTLDVTKKFLFNHFKDEPNDPHRRFVMTPQTYELVGVKDRAGGKEQIVIGQWKSLDGPGHLIKTYLDRVSPLRELLKKQLAEEKRRYEDMVRQGAAYNALRTQFSQIKALEEGCRSVWLYVTRTGNIRWITKVGLLKSGLIDGKQASFIEEIVHLLNVQRAANKEVHLPPIPHARPQDFRVWFATYVYQRSNGSILQVKKALNHSLLRTAVGYVNTNILNQEASDAARRFLEILMDELDMGRVDLTILAHLHRYGKLTPEQEQLLTQARTLQRSRMNIACKDAHHPPAHIKATEGESCDVQRCLLCMENAVLLPESVDGIAMRVEELRALQGFLPVETWVEDRYDIELKNNLTALRKFDLNQGLATRKKWAEAITRGQHYVPGLPLGSSPDLMELV